MNNMTLKQIPEMISEARLKINQARTVAVLTGAGISAESGVPTFRGKDGLWKNYRSEELATPQAFENHPKTVWGWYNWRRGLISTKKPNQGHEALAMLEGRVELTLITQNVDGLHQLAGSDNLLEIHGNIWRLRCTICRHTYEDRTHPLEYPPLCPRCGRLQRPDVVWFGEALDANLIDQAITAVTQADLMLVIGTSAQVQPAASLAWQAKYHGAFVIEINIETTPFSNEADLCIPGLSGRILPTIIL